MSIWIKCSERLPEIGKEVLLRIPTCGHWNVEGGSYRGDGIWYGAFCSTRGKGKCYQVTQWAEAPSDAEPANAAPLRELLAEAYDAGYAEGQARPDGHHDSDERDRFVTAMMNPQ